MLIDKGKTDKPEIKDLKPKIKNQNSNNPTNLQTESFTFLSGFNYVNF